MNGHQLYRFSVTIHSDDLALVGCLRALSQHAQATGNPRIPWGGTKREDWQRDKHKVTFRFSSQTYREDFLKQVERLLPSGLWQKVAESDNDPATPQTDLQ